MNTTVDRDISDYRVEFVVRGIDRRAFAARQIKRYKAGQSLGAKFYENLKRYATVVDAAAATANDCATEMALSAPFETYQSARDFLMVAEQNGAFALSIKTRFRIRDKPGSDKFVVLRDPPDWVRTQAMGAAA